jgi:hypothetical protein
MKRFYPLYTLTILLLTLLASGTALAAANSMSFSVKSEFNVVTTHSTDSATFDRSGSTVTIKGFVPHTGNRDLRAFDRRCIVGELLARQHLSVAVGNRDDHLVRLGGG